MTYTPSGLDEFAPAMTLADFLSARLDEDEAVARMIAPSGVILIGPGLSSDAARFDFARVLADVEAKRRIVEVYLSERSRRDVLQREDAREVEDERQMTQRRTSAARCRGLEIAAEFLAQPYASHPDFRPEWRIPDAATQAAYDVYERRGDGS